MALNIVMRPSVTQQQNAIKEKGVGREKGMVRKQQTILPGHRCFSLSLPACTHWLEEMHEQEVVV